MQRVSCACLTAKQGGRNAGDGAGGGGDANAGGRDCLFSDFNFNFKRNHLHFHLHLPSLTSTSSPTLFLPHSLCQNRHFHHTRFVHSFHRRSFYHPVTRFNKTANMKSLVATVAALGVFAGLSTADDTCSSLTAVAELCPSCDGKNVTDAGSKWAVSCDYRTYGTGQQDVLGEVTLEGCFDACDDAENCYGINIAANGSCSIVSGDQKALSSESGWTNLYRFPSPASSGSGTASSAVADPQITSTVFTGGLTQSASSAPPVSITSTDSAASATPSCDLELDNLCPDCNGTVVSNNDGGDSYTIVCDVELDSSNGTYSVQDELSPAGCIHQCDTLPFCKGASYYDYRACEIDKGDLTSSSKSGYTAFVPVTSTSAPLTSSKVSISATTTDPTFSILPTSSGCDPNAITCPECNGIAVPDKLNASYTVLCGIQPVCDSEPIRNAISQDVCMQYCDQGMFPRHPQLLEIADLTQT